MSAATVHSLRSNHATAPTFLLNRGAFVSDNRFILTLRCPDAPGVIHAVSGALLELPGNVLEQAQYTNESTGMFVMRTRFEASGVGVNEVRSAIERATEQFAPTITVRNEDDLPRVLIMVSQYDHCLVDLLYRQSHDEIRMTVPVIVSNHEVCRPIAEQYGIPFEYVPLEKGAAGAKEAAENQLRALIDEYDADAVILARYMQILSDDLCRDLEGRAINIHHSFLPGFKGARPYHQAYDRGVKLIGATAHFVTADLDEGPIIEQDVERVEHHQTPEDLAQIGRDIERLVLARAVKLYAEDRVLLDGHRTVVFA